MKLLLEQVDWSYYDKFESINDKYLPDRGEGDTMASQIVTAVNKLIYKWYNDGDVFDNTHGLDGWANDLSSYANWLYKYVPETKYTLDLIEEITNDNGYEELLQLLADLTLDEKFLSKYQKDKVGSIYNCDGPFEYREYSEDEDDEYFDESLNLSESVRIVYDDSMADTFVNLFEKFISRLDIDTIERDRDDYLSDVSFKDKLSEFVKSKGFTIGKKAEHARGIGNNNAYAVYYNDERELQQCCLLHVNFGFYGELFVYVTDYDDNDLSTAYEIHAHGIRKIRE